MHGNGVNEPASDMPRLTPYERIVRDEIERWRDELCRGLFPKTTCV